MSTVWNERHTLHKEYELTQRLCDKQLRILQLESELAKKDRLIEGYTRVAAQMVDTFRKYEERRGTL